MSSQRTSLSRSQTDCAVSSPDTVWAQWLSQGPFVAMCSCVLPNTDDPSLDCLTSEINWATRVRHETPL